MRALGVFLFHLFYFILITTRYESPRQPMTANEGQRRSTKANQDKKGPNDASGVVWALGVFLFHVFYFILITTRHESPRQPMTAHEDEKGPKQRVWRCLGPRCVSFSFILFYSYYYETRKPTAANDGQQRPTKANAGQRRPTAANDGQRRPTKTKRAQTTRLASFGP